MSAMRQGLLGLGVLLRLLGGSTAQALAFRTAVLDPGHGGRDGGAVCYGKAEKRLCLDVALRVESILKRRGLEVFCLSSRGKVLGTSILRSHLKTTSSRGLLRGNLKVLSEIVTPAVVMEAGYMSHRGGAERLASPSHRQAIAEAIAAGILKARG
jgi:N-acetylmuramoyl-L-alanine amidase